MSFLDNMRYRIFPAKQSARINQRLSGLLNSVEQVEFTSQTLSSVIDRISATVASARWRHYKIVESNEENPYTVYDEQNNSLIYALSVAPNDFKTPQKFWSEVCAKIILDGCAVVVPERNQSGNVAKVWLADSWTVSSDLQTVNVSVFGNETTQPLNQCFIFENPNRVQANKLNTVLGMINRQLNLIDWQARQILDGKISAVLNVDTRADSVQNVQQIRERVQRLFVTTNAGPIAVTFRGEELKQLNAPIKQSDGADTDDLTKKVYSALGVPESIVNSTYTEQEWSAFLTNVVRPICSVIEQEVFKKTYSIYGYGAGNRFSFEPDPFAGATVKDLFTSAGLAVYHGVMSPNEVRRRFFDIAPYDSGDVFRTNRNAVDVSTDLTSLDDTIGNEKH